jgi:hypothetical protein
MTLNRAVGHARSRILLVCADWKTWLGLIAVRSGASTLVTSGPDSGIRKVRSNTRCYGPVQGSAAPLQACRHRSFADSDSTDTANLSCSCGFPSRPACPRAAIHRQPRGRTMAHAESKKNARLADKACGKICGTVMTLGRRVRCQDCFASDYRLSFPRSAHDLVREPVHASCALGCRNFEIGGLAETAAARHDRRGFRGARAGVPVGIVGVLFRRLLQQAQ